MAVPGLVAATDDRILARADFPSRLEALLTEMADGKPGRIVSHIYRTVRAFAEGDLHDDCALLALKAKEVWKHPAQL